MISFTDSPRSPDHRPLVVTDDGEVDVVATLAGLQGVAADVPVLLEECYRNVQDGLALLLRLRMETGMPASRCPVYMRLAHPVERHVRRHPKFAVLCTDGVALLEEGQDPGTADAPSPLSDEQLRKVLEGLPIRPDGDGSRHDLANRWGPVRLWRGLQRLRPSSDVTPNPPWMREIDRELRREEPYAYLLALADLRGGANIQNEASESWVEWKTFARRHSASPLRVLLLDDEIDRGWGDVIEAALGVPGIAVDTTLAGVDFDAQGDVVESKVLGEQWDLVLADLRVRGEDRAGGVTRGALQYGGAGWIRRLKSSRPETAIVAFTASNKAWSTHDLQDLGVDGYWIKEGPEFGVDDGYSRDHAAALIDAVLTALEQRSAARPVWDLAERIQTLTGAPRADAVHWKEAMTGAAPTAYVLGWSRALGVPASHVQARLVAIVSRLRRAYGLLIMGRSSHAEKAFALRREDLAFSAVWGIGNEVRKLYFDGPDHDPERQLWELPSATFVVRDPSTGHSLVYWETAGTRVVVELDRVPEYAAEAICPKDKERRPRWPSLGADNAKVEWLLELSGRNDLADRFEGTGMHEYNGLRYLRNHLEDTHGQIQIKEEKIKGPQHASLADVRDLCEVWRALLVDPYA